MKQIGAAMRGDADRDADTGRCDNLMPLKAARSLESGENLLGHAHGFGGIGNSIQEHGEFVAAHPSHCVLGSHAAFQAGRYFNKKAIAGLMPQAIVNHFEPVEIEKQ